MTANQDFLHDSAVRLDGYLLAKEIPHELHIYGDMENPRGHVFHCNQRTTSPAVQPGRAELLQKALKAVVNNINAPLYKDAFSFRLLFLLWLGAENNIIDLTKVGFLAIYEPLHHRCPPPAGHSSLQLQHSLPERSSS